MDENHLYRVDATSTGLKLGFLGSPDDLPELSVASPPQFDGPERIWSPEHLFVAAVTSCLMTTFRSIADMSGLEVLDYSDSADGLLVRGEDRLYRIAEVTLRPHVVIADPSKVDRAMRLLEKAERVCLVSRSIDSKIVLEPTVTVAARV